MSEPASERVRAITEGLVLVADDSAVVRAIVASQLAAHGWEVAEAADGVGTVEACRRVRPEIVLLDIEMPRMDGYEVLSALRGTAELAGISVIFLTKFNSAEDVAEGLRR